jgi:hypothetical protein
VAPTGVDPVTFRFSVEMWELFAKRNPAKTASFQRFSVTGRDQDALDFNRSVAKMCPRPAARSRPIPPMAAFEE